MRLDKFLKVSRLVKRRPLAKEMAGEGRITVNGQPAKASTVLAEGDELVLKFGQKIVNLEVTHLSEAARKEDAETMYRVISEERMN